MITTREEHDGQRLMAVQFELAVRRAAQETRSRGLPYDRIAEILARVAEDISPGVLKS